MGDWARRFFDNLVQREGDDHTKIQQQVLERQQILATAPELWKQLAYGIREEANDLNDMRPGLVTIKDEIGAASPNLSVSTGALTLKLAFKKDIPKIIYSVTQSQGPSLQSLQVVDKELSFRIFGGDVWLYREEGKIGTDGATQILLAYLTA